MNNVILNIKHQEVFTYASLAKAAYSDFSNVRFSITKNNKAIAAKKAIKTKEENSAFADLVGTNYEVVAHWKDRGGDDFSPRNISDIWEKESGFSATLFRSNESGKYILAHKGTQGWKDLLGADVGDIVANGVAHNQVVDMYNFWQQIKYSGEKNKPYMAAYLDRDQDKTDEIISAMNRGAGEEKRRQAIGEGYYLNGSVAYRVAFKPSNELYDDERAYAFENPIDVQNVVSTGHSLGGHLAAIFSRLFPEVTEKVVMFNGAGTGSKTSAIPLIVDGISADANVKNLLSGLNHGQPTNFDKSKIVNLTANKNIDIVANNWKIGLTQPGEQWRIFVESGDKDIYAHGMAQILDSTAVIHLLASLDKSFNDKPLKNILEFFNKSLDYVSKDSNNLGTLERSINAMSELLLGNNPSIKNDEKNETKEREKFYDVVTKLSQSLQGDEKVIQAINNGASVEPIELAGLRNKAFMNNAEGMATRFSLKNALPFLIKGDGFYTDHSPMGDRINHLKLFDVNNPESAVGMTEEYLNKKISMMDGIINPQNATFHYHDLASNVFISGRTGVDDQTSNSIETAGRVIFGSDKDDNAETGLVGNDKFGDFLFGGTGKDVLDGKSGDDYLEGGKDFDTYIINGHDTVLDTDGQGRLIFDNEKGESPTLFSNSTDNAFVSDGLWFSVNKKGDPDNKFVARQDNDDLIITQSGSGHEATIKNYFKQVGKVEGHPLGIELKQSDVDKTSPRAPKIFDFSAFDKQEHAYNFKSSGSVEIIGTALRDSIDAGPLKADKDTGFALVARTGAGNDLVFGSFERDWIHGGDDADILNGSRFILPVNERRSDEDKKKDRDEIIGGGGGDFINGMAGDDVLYADKQESHLEKGNIVITEQGDWVLGGEGNDQLFGSVNQDFLQGGEGSDTVIGGAGNDVILGDGVMRADVRMQRKFHNLPYDVAVKYKPSYGPGGTTIFTPEILTEQAKNYPALDHTFDGEAWETVGNQNTANLPAELVSWSIKILREQGEYEINAPFGHEDKEEHRAASGGAQDFLYGGDGDDLIIGQDGGDTLHGGEGDDILWGDDNGHAGSGAIAPAEGADNDDTLYGDAGNDTLYGGIGKDNLIGGAGSDTLRGGADSDDYYFTSSELDENTTDTVEDDGKTDHIYLDSSRAADLIWRKVDEHHWDSGQGWKLAWYGGRAQITYADKPGIISIPIFANGLYGINLADSSSDNPVNPNPDEPKPVNPNPDEPKPVNPNPDEPKPVNPNPDEPKPDNPNPDEPKPVNPNPDEPKPDNPNPDEPKPVNPNPDEPKPDNPKPVDPKPVEPEAGRTLYGTNGDDTLIGGNGDDEIYTGAGNDLVFGQYGNDKLYGDEGNDELQGGDGEDELYGGNGDDYLFGQNGNDKLFGDNGNDKMVGGAGEDELFGGHGNDHLFGNEGNDKLYGDEGNDELQGGDGEDELYGGKGDDTLFGGDGNDKLFGDNGNDKMVGGAGEDELYGSLGNDLLIGGDGNDALFGEADNDELQGGNGEDTLHAGEGDDILFGQDGDDVLIGGAGNDYQSGGAGDDTYRVSKGHGQDVIHDRGHSTDNDTLQLEDIRLGEVQFRQEAQDLLLYGYNGNDSIRIRDCFAADGNSRIEHFAFADKTVTLDDIRQQHALDARSAAHAQQLINAMAASAGAQAVPAQAAPDNGNLLTPPLLINPLQTP